MFASDRTCPTWVILIALVALPFCAVNAQQELPDWVTQYSTYARQDPLGFVSLLANMPAEQQQTFLTLVGVALQEKNGLACNPLGGTDSCMTLSSNSKFAQLCPGHDLKVDCAFYSDDLEEVDQDPAADMRQLLRSHGMQGLEASCPQCFANQQKLWCAQTIPACGSFQENILGHILPALAQAVSAQQTGQTQTEALSLVMPQLLQASALSMPCREMCEAVVSTCGCNSQRTLGSLLDAALSDITLPNQQLPDDFSQQVFGSLYDQPLCALYASSDTAGFTGVCEAMDSQCSDDAMWCHGGSNPDSQGVEELIALQLTKGLFGWVGNHSMGLFADEAEAADDADQPREKAVEDQYTHSSGHHHHHAAVVVSILVAVAAFVAAVAMVLYARPELPTLPNMRRLRQLFSRRQTNSQEYLELNNTEQQEPLVFGGTANHTP